MKTQTKSYDLQDRLIDFSISLIQLTDSLPSGFIFQHLSRQILRSGTSCALNYGEAQAAESKKDFIHKMKLVLKELRETQVSLTIFSKTGDKWGHSRFTGM